MFLSTTLGNRQLETIEKSFLDPDSFTGMERQGVTEALAAAKLSRSLERPRTETDGRFQRAIRLADAHGAYRQKLEARYEALWTAVWWFDDCNELNSSYDAFEALVIDSDHAINLEFLSNLLQVSQYRDPWRLHARAMRSRHTRGPAQGKA